MLEKLTLTDWAALPLNVQPLFWGTVQIGTTDFGVHFVTLHHAILKGQKSRISETILLEN